jgi:hypothetical protein
MKLIHYKISLIAIIVVVILVFMIIMPSCVQAQNIVSATYERSDNGVGLRYDHQFPKTGKYGFYVAGGYGVYVRNEMNDYKHAKAQLGFTRYLRNYAEPNWLVAFSIGLNAHHYTEIDYGYKPVEEIALRPVSGDLGVMFIIDQRLSLGWTWDILKSDCVFCLGYRFGNGVLK